MTPERIADPSHVSGAISASLMNGLDRSDGRKARLRPGETPLLPPLVRLQSKRDWIRLAKLAEPYWRSESATAPRVWDVKPCSASSRIR